MLKLKPTKEELIEIVQKIMCAEGSEEELDSLILLLEQNVPHPNVSDLIFWNEEELSAEDVVEQALSYKRELLS
ncbi:bacteriocin immunity protein [Paenibacillus sp. CCS19]|uniref:bacteriocin immunity protein n=1 Tax=Paenibacillus sp. CCS19 TaxID=3158387 RepID=UPI00295E7810|nr:bacteriocin immunity protein [Paenibacillus cellulosilyticus]